MMGLVYSLHVSVVIFLGFLSVWSVGTIVSSNENSAFPIYLALRFSHPHSGKAFMQAQKCLQRSLLCLQSKHVQFGKVCSLP